MIKLNRREIRQSFSDALLNLKRSLVVVNDQYFCRQSMIVRHGKLLQNKRMRTKTCLVIVVSALAALTFIAKFPGFLAEPWQASL